MRRVRSDGARSEHGYALTNSTSNDSPFNKLVASSIRGPIIRPSNKIRPVDSPSGQFVIQSIRTQSTSSAHSSQSPVSSSSNNVFGVLVQAHHPVNFWIT
jgi:hypothetical protein